jgi:hypothetical protein
MEACYYRFDLPWEGDREKEKLERARTSAVVYLHGVGKALQEKGGSTSVKAFEPNSF